MINQAKKLPLWFYVFLLALIVRLWGISHGLPYVTHPDENMVVRRALRFGSGDLNPHFFYYPSFTMYLFFAGYGVYFLFGWAIHIFHNSHDFALSFINNLKPIYIISRIIIASFDALTAVFIMKIVKRISEEKISLLAGLLWSLLPIALYESKLAKPDLMMTSLALMSTYVIFGQHKYKYLLAGLFIGLAGSSKYQAAALIIPSVCFLILDKDEPAKLKQFIFLGVASFCGFVMGAPYTLLDFHTFYSQFSDQSAIMATGMTGLEGGPAGWTLYLKVIFSPENNPIVGLFIFLGILIGSFTKKREVLYCTIATFTFYLLLGRMRVIGSHYFYIGLPYLIILSAFGFSAVLNWASKKQYHAEKIFSFIALLMVGIYFVQAAPILSKFGHKDTRVLAYEWINKNIPPDSHILSDASGPTLPLSKTQLSRLYEQAKAVGHIKADLFKLQIEAATAHGYTVFLTEQAIMMTPKELLNYSRQAQDLLPIDKGLEWIKQQGIDYVVCSDFEWGSYESAAGKEKHPRQAGFYKDLREKASLLADFNPSNTKGPGPHIIIYKLIG